MSPDPTDAWNSREFHVKWKRWSYIHCSWDTLSTLSQLGGFKRVINYMRRMDDLAVARSRTSREENELRDVERQMEEQLVQQHMEVVPPPPPCMHKSCLHDTAFKCAVIDMPDPFTLPPWCSVMTMPAAQRLSAQCVSSLIEQTTSPIAAQNLRYD